MSADWLPLRCGSGLVMRLLPQRPPFLMVDRVDAWRPGDRPGARASRFLSANDPVFAGHFPALAVFPGALLVEAVGQCASLAVTLGAVEAAYAARGAGPAALVADLDALDAVFSLRPGARPPPAADELLAAFARVSGLPVGVAGQIRAKFLRPVVPGCRLALEAVLSARLGEQLRFEVSAAVDGELVMEGALAAASVSDVPLPGRA